jgi:hypothetical protein
VEKAFFLNSFEWRIPSSWIRWTLASSGWLPMRSYMSLLPAMIGDFWWIWLMNATGWWKRIELMNFPYYIVAFYPKLICVFVWHYSSAIWHPIYFKQMAYFWSMFHFNNVLMLVLVRSSDQLYFYFIKFWFHYFVSYDLSFAIFRRYTEARNNL